MQHGFPASLQAKDADALDFASDLMRADKEVGFFRSLRIKKGSLTNGWGPVVSVDVFPIEAGDFPVSHVDFPGWWFQILVYFQPYLGNDPI